MTSHYLNDNCKFLKVVSECPHPPPPPLCIYLLLLAKTQSHLQIFELALSPGSRLSHHSLQPQRPLKLGVPFVCSHNSTSIRVFARLSTCWLPFSVCEAHARSQFSECVGYC